ncbi:MAG: peptide ABC transporter permease [Mesorhizobium amorphae]|nr:MAG: peptide ABC transporter permease [Mesorhizobium amorphae]
MLSYTLRRIGLSVAITVVALVILISMIQLIPGDPAAVLLGPLASQATRDAFRVQMGLDQPAIVQIARFFGRVLQGDLGTDALTGRPVLRVVMEQLPFTLSLIFASILWSATLGIALGCWSAVRRGSVADTLVGILSVGSIALPSFVVAIYGLLIFSVGLGWFPTIGAGPPGDPLAQLYYLVLPSLAVGLGWVGYLARMVRASMLEVLGENHIRMARAFGLPERTITFRYALKIAIIPTVALLGLGIGNMISGAVFAEIVFARPGVGRLIFDAIATRNYPVVMGAVMLTTVFYVLSTLCADLVAAWLDPRVRASL